MEINKPDILIVDDEAVIRNLLSEFFKKKGYEVRVAGNGADALKIFDECGSRLVLADFHMSVMDGLDLADELRKRHQDILIILMTGDPEMKIRGAADYIVYKPFNFNEFFTFLQCVATENVQNCPAQIGHSA